MLALAGPSLYHWPIKSRPFSSINSLSFSALSIVTSLQDKIQTKISKIINNLNEAIFSFFTKGQFLVKKKHLESIRSTFHKRYKTRHTVLGYFSKARCSALIGSQVVGNNMTSALLIVVNMM